MERRKKRLIRLGAAALALTAALTACGGGNQAQTEPSAPEVEAAPNVEEIAVDFLPTLGRVTDMEYRYDENSGAVVNRMDTQLIGADAFTHEAYPELSAALDKLRTEALAMEKEAYQERETALTELAAEGGQTYELFGEMRSLVRRADEQAVSVVNAWQEYAGGVHGSYGYAVSNFDTHTGEPIALESLLTPEGKSTLNSRIGAELDALYPDSKPGAMVAEYLTDEYAFSLEPDGVTFWFNPYEIASYAEGLLTVKLYFDRDADILNGAYKGRNEAWFVELGDTVPYRFADKNGTLRTLEFWENVDFEIPDWFTGFGFAFDGKTVQVDYGAFTMEPYYAHTPEGDYLAVAMTLEDDGDGMLIYGADGARIEEAYGKSPDFFWYPSPPEGARDFSDYTAYGLTLTDPYKMPLSVHMDLFGTWSAKGLYRLTASGLERVDKVLYNTSPYEVTLKRDLTVTRLSDDDWTASTGEEVALPTGTVVRIAGTDGDKTAYFEVLEYPEGSGETFAFALSYGAEKRQVNGVNEHDLFDGLIYAS